MGIEAGVWASDQSCLGGSVSVHVSKPEHSPWLQDPPLCLPLTFSRRALLGHC